MRCAALSMWRDNDVPVEEIAYLRSMGCTVLNASSFWQTCLQQLRICRQQLMRRASFLENSKEIL